MEKKNTGLIILIIILSVLVVGLSGFVIYHKLFNNNDVNGGQNHDNGVEGTPIGNVVIENSEVKDLYNYVQASLNSNNVCLGYYYQNSFKNHTLEDKISLVLINYANNYIKKIDDEFLSKIPEGEREFIKVNYLYYVDENYVKEGMKTIFNIDIDLFNDENNYGVWKYITDAKAFIQGFGGGDYSAKIIQQIIEYAEIEDEINIVVAKAEILPSSQTIIDENGQKTKSAGVYRYMNKNNTLVFENVTYDFRFTKENVDKFSQLKYVFKKNDNGKYYVSDIINLNFEEDFVDCK